MDFGTKVGFALAIGGIGLSIAVFFATYIWREMPRWLAMIGFASGVLLCIAALGCFIFIPNPEEPEVTLSFVNEKAPLIQLHNTSNVTASNIKWLIAAFDVDSFQQTKSPLQIPASIFDFLPSHDSSLPIDLFSRPLVSPFVKNGDKIIGSASVYCPACKRGHTYVFSITLGAGGWYGEETKIANGNVVIPDITNLAQATQGLENRIPTQARIQIKDIVLVRPP
jgi:hypothetical protein